MSLFVTVLTIGVGALLVLINSNLKAQNIQESVSNVQFALDSMSREIRTGFAYYCSNGSETLGDVDVHQDCNKGTYLSIIEGGKSLTNDEQNRRIAYRYNAGEESIERKIGNGSWIRLTSETVKISSMYFNVNGTPVKEDTGDTSQPNVTISINGDVEGIADTSSSFSLQTTVTQRGIDL